ncbi:NADH-quinone oxidoreductase subunit NuoE [Moorellaceae bacterium AZ2]
MSCLKHEIQQIIRHHEGQVSHLIAILQEVQQKYRYLPEEALEVIAGDLHISPAVVWGVATFYAQFSLKPKGQYTIRICNGTACHVRGATQIHEALCKELQLKGGENTTGDLKFTVETVSCLGACGLAPVMTINDNEVHGQLTPEGAVSIVRGLKERAAKEENGKARGRDHVA